MSLANPLFGPLVYITRQVMPKAMGCRKGVLATCFTVHGEQHDLLQSGVWREGGCDDEGWAVHDTAELICHE